MPWQSVQKWITLFDMFASASGCRPVRGPRIDVLLSWGSAALHVTPHAVIRSPGLCVSVALLCVMLGAAARSSAVGVPIVPQASSAVVTGTVTDQTNAVVVDAEVVTLNLASGRQSTTKTDTSGKYELAGLSPGSYQISVSGEGFAAAAQSISLRSGGSYHADFQLAPGPIEINITVTAGRGSERLAAEIPQTITVASASQIEERRPASTLRAAENAPNLTSVNSNPALERPRLRGLASNRLLIILDGERLNNMRSDPLSGVSPSVVDVTQLQSAEVVSGAGSSLYGSDAMAGVMNLITASPVRDNHLAFRFNGDARTNGAFRRGAATINWSRSSFAVRLSGSIFREGDYRGGNQLISLNEVVQLGSLATDMGNTVGNNVSRTYAVWSAPAGVRVTNAQGHGFNDQVDGWFFPGLKHSLHYRQLNSQHKSLGFSFIAPPFDPRMQFNSFRRLDKYGLRYEGRELRSWLPRVSAGFYWQKYAFPDDTITSQIGLGSSWRLVPDPNAPQTLLPQLTGSRSTFTPVNLSQNKNSVSTYGLDLQATVVPFSRALLTTGVGYLRDSSADEFSRTDLVAPFALLSGRASNPDSVYRNLGWFSLLEHEPLKWLRLTGGVRVDNWRTEARVTQGFPVGVESRLLDLSFSMLNTNPGPINMSGAASVLDLVRGVKGITTSRTVVTGNAAAVVRWPQGINTYFRWGNSYREPGITERYLLRDFGDPTFSVLVIPNAALNPERGSEYDVGVKIRRARWNVSVGYFRNNLNDFIASAFAPPLFVPPDPAQGINPISPFFPFHGVLYVQRTNTARARISGIEATYEVSLHLDRVGVVTPYGSLGSLKGSNLTPDQNTLKLLAQFYNRSDTPVPLRGSANDAPLSSITPLRTINGVRFDSSTGRWFGQYEIRYQGRVKRADPLDLSAAVSTEFGTLRSLNSFAVETLRGGYVVRGEKHRVAFTVGLENLTNRLYFEHFQTAPAPGRSVVFGTTVEFKTKTE